MSLSNRFSHAKALVVAFALAMPFMASSAFAADAGFSLDLSDLKTIIIGLIASVSLIGTAYLTVLVSVSAFGMIRRVIRG